MRVNACILLLAFVAMSPATHWLWIPLPVLVRGQNSQEAEAAALQRYLNYTVGGVAKHNTF